MNLLRKLTPAETSIILDPDRVERRELLKLTMMDLILKRVIKISDNPDLLFSDKNKIAFHIEVGDNYGKIHLKEHENILIKPFGNDSTIRILFKHFTKLMYDNSINVSHYSYIIKDEIRKNENTSSYFKNGFWIRFFSIFKFNDSGEIFQNKIKGYFSELNNMINELSLGSLNEDNTDLLNLLKNVGGNIFIVKDVDYKLLQKIYDVEFDKKEKVDINFPESISLNMIFSVITDTSLELINSFELEFDTIESEYDSDSDSDCDSDGCDGCD